MTTLKFKTTINCGRCLKTVRPFLEDIEGIKSWSVDTSNPNKILMVETINTTTSTIIEVVEDAGFDIEAI